jgi:hypothetical protein
MKLRALHVFDPAYGQIDLKNATLILKDGTTPTPQQLEIKIGEGNFTWTERQEMNYVLDRGRLDIVNEGDEQPVEVSIDGVWEFITAFAGDPPTLIDALKRTGEAAPAADNWVSVDPDVCQPYAVLLEIQHVPVCAGATVAASDPLEITTIDLFRWEQIDYDLRAGTFAISGRANVTEAISSRFTQTST